MITSWPIFYLVRVTDHFKSFQAFQVIKLFLESLEKHSENVMSDSAQQEQSGAGQKVRSPLFGLLQKRLPFWLCPASSAASWTGWAVSSLTSKLYSAGGSRTVSGVATAGPGSTTVPESSSAGEPRGSAAAEQHQQAAAKGLCTSGHGFAGK